MLIFTIKHQIQAQVKLIFFSSFAQIFAISQRIWQSETLNVEEREGLHNCTRLEDGLKIKGIIILDLTKCNVTRQMFRQKTSRYYPNIEAINDLSIHTLEVQTN